MFCFSLLRFAASGKVSNAIGLKIKNSLVYWGARMQQIAASFSRCNIGVCLAKTVHASWLQLGMIKTSLGGAVLCDLSATIRSQVSCELPLGF